jgi:dihydropyrimidinase
MPLLIKGGEIVTADSRYVADIYVENETITQIGTNLNVPADTEVIDGKGKLVFPGFIDPHVHIHLPFMATFAKDTHETASIAGLIGGTTTYIEMACPDRTQDTLEGYKLWKAKAEGHSASDYAFHMGVTKFDDKTAGQLREIVADGTASFKVFLAYKNFFGVEDGELFQTLKLAKELGVITTAHCENAELVGRLQRELVTAGKTGPEWHEPSRPEAVEAEGTGRFATFLETTGAAGYIVHLSCAPALATALAAKSRGVPLYIESVVPHFFLDKSMAGKPGVEGAKYIMSPPLRDKTNQKPLWDALAQGIIDTVGTDHCPFDVSQKKLGDGDFTKIPNGIPAIEERVNLMYTYGVKTGRLDIHRFVDALSTKTAKLFGLFPRKGTIAVGSDADLVIYDPSYEGVISAKTHSINSDYSGFEGTKIGGRPSVVTVRGRVQVKDGNFVGTKGIGKMLKRKPQYF